MSRGIQTPSKVEPKTMTILLGTLVMTLAVVPFVERFFVGRLALLLGLTAICVVGSFAYRNRPVILVPCIVIAALAIPVTWSTLFFDDTWLFLTGCLLACAFFLTTAVAILATVFRRHIAKAPSVSGAICAYLLIGLAWAMVYWGVDRGNPLALEIPHRRVLPYTFDGKPATAFSQMVYVSFVTMSTLGYGDITPRTQAAETLMWLQSVAGQFYMAALVAHLIAALPSRGHGPDD